jgi:hypothetical protein
VRRERGKPFVVEHRRLPAKEPPAGGKFEQAPPANAQRAEEKRRAQWARSIAAEAFKRR